MDPPPETIEERAARLEQELFSLKRYYSGWRATLRSIAIYVMVASPFTFFRAWQHNYIKARAETAERELAITRAALAIERAIYPAIYPAPKIVTEPAPVPVEISWTHGTRWSDCLLRRRVLAGAEGFTKHRVVVWTEPDSNTRVDARATLNLTRIAGIALESATSGNYGDVCVYGPAEVEAEGDVSVGHSVGTSPIKAGAVQQFAHPPRGSVIGHVMESVGVTHAAKALVFVDLQ
jgi:hypothetical protein